MSVRTVVLLVLNAALVGGVFAQEGAVRVTAEVDAEEVSVGDAVVFTVEVQGAPATVVQTPTRPTPVNLEPQQRVPETRQTRADEGETERGVVFSWRLRARRPGPAHIPPVPVVVGGEEYATNEIRLRVSRQSEQSASPTLTRPEGSGADAALDERDLFVQATATADQAYQNEQVVVEYRLFYRPGVRLRHSRLAGSWDAPGFWREELNVASRPTPQTQQAHGRPYETVVLKRVALFPTRPGTLRIDPLRIESEAQGTVQLRQNGPSLRGRFEPVQLVSQSLSLQVRPLPASPPNSFDGAVGQFSLSVSADADSVRVGDPVSLRIRVQGTGNLNTLSAPGLSVPSALHASEPTVETDVERNGERIRGTKTFTYTLVPRTDGRHALSPIVFSYFNPETERYETRRADGPVFQVSGETASRVVGRTGDGLPVGDVADLMEAEEARWGRIDRRPLYRSPWAYLALLVPILLGGGGALYRRRWEAGGRATKEETDASLAAAQAHLQNARRHSQNGADSAVYDAVERALRIFLDERLGGEGSLVTRPALDRQLVRQDLPASLREALYDLLDRCGEAQYAPSASNQEALNLVLDEAQTLLRQLDEHLSSSERSTRDA